MYSGIVALSHGKYVLGCFCLGSWSDKKMIEAILPVHVRLGFKKYIDLFSLAGKKQMNILI